LNKVYHKKDTRRMRGETTILGFQKIIAFAGLLESRQQEEWENDKLTNAHKNDLR
jgi:hypothetical protein